MELKLSNMYSKLDEGKSISIDDFGFKNIDEQGLAVLKQVDDLIKYGNIQEANKVLSIATSYGGALEKCCFTNEHLARIFEELYNIEILVLAKRQDVHRDNSKIPNCKQGDIWLSNIKDISNLG